MVNRISAIKTCDVFGPNLFDRCPAVKPWFLAALRFARPYLLGADGQDWWCKSEKKKQKITMGTKKPSFLSATTHILGPKTLIFHGFGVPRQLHRWTPLQGSMERDQVSCLFFRAKKSPQPPAPADTTTTAFLRGGIRLVLQRGSESNDFSYLGRFGCRRDPDSFLGGIKNTNDFFVVRLIWMFPKIGGKPQNGWYNGKPY